MPNDKLKELEGQLEELKQHLSPLLAECRRLEREILLAKSQFKIGEVILWEGRRGRVVDVRPWLDGVSWVVRRIRKDGSEGMLCDVRHWNNPVKA